VNTTGIFNSSLKGFLPNTTYYFRAKVETVLASGVEVGSSPDTAFSSLTSYGAEGHFTTPAAPIPWVLIITLIMCMAIAVICIFIFITRRHRRLAK